MCDWGREECRHFDSQGSDLDGVGMSALDFIYAVVQDFIHLQGQRQFSCDLGRAKGRLLALIQKILDHTSCKASEHTCHTPDTTVMPQLFCRE